MACLGVHFCSVLTVSEVSDARPGVTAEHAADVTVGDVVTLIGEEGGATLSAHDLAEASGTISYEVLCAISSRVPRRYL